VPSCGLCDSGRTLCFRASVTHRVGCGSGVLALSICLCILVCLGVLACCRLLVLRLCSFAELYVWHCVPSVLWCCWLSGRKGIQPVKKTEWWGAGVVVCLERGADLHMTQRTPLPLTVSCFSKIQIGFYRAMLCIRGTSHGPVSLRLSVCPSVHLSVTSRSSTKTAKRRITQTTPHDSPETLVFWSQRSLRHSTWVTPYEGAKCRWGGSKSATFDK